MEQGRGIRGAAEGVEGVTDLSMYLGGSRRRLWQQLLQKILPHILRRDVTHSAATHRSQEDVEFHDPR